MSSFKVYCIHTICNGLPVASLIGSASVMLIPFVLNLDKRIQYDAEHCKHIHRDYFVPVCPNPPPLLSPLSSDKLLTVSQLM